MARFRIRYDDANIPEEEFDAVYRRRGPGGGLPSFETRPEAEEFVRKMNRQLNLKFGKPQKPPFAIYYIEDLQAQDIE